MPELTPKERVLRVLQRQVPDRVPHFEWLVDRRVRDAILPGCADHNEFAVRMGHDAVLVDPLFAKTPLGAAMLAGIGIGAYRDEEDALAHVARPGIVYEPDPAAARIYADLFPVYRQLYPSLKSISHRLYRQFVASQD